MGKKIINKLYIGSGLVIVLIILSILEDTTVLKEKIPLLQLERIVKSAIILLLAHVFIKLIVIIPIDEINKTREKKLSTVIKSSISIIIYSIASIIIMTGVYGKSIISISAFFIGSWAVIAISVKDFAVNCVNGILLDYTSDFEVGDWIKLKDGTIAKISDMKLAGVDLLLEDDTSFHITSTSFNSGEIINLSKPTKDYVQIIEVVLEDTVPPDTAKQILKNAVISSGFVHNNDAKVFANSAELCGITYHIAFRIKGREFFRDARHAVITSIIKCLHTNGYTLCHISSEIKVRLEASNTASTIGEIMRNSKN
ncbi:MAG: mechanosensitive ion channel [Holosporales bacterium]|jgi:small-conductance mechanosensitive channel|nr:mechanosensitive ion channel [Holosporales bacterium]